MNVFLHDPKLMHPGAHAAANPNHPAVLMAGGESTVTYREFNDNSLSLARALRSHGLRLGDQIAILLSNSPRFLEVAWAAQRSGLRWTPISTQLTAGEIEYIVRDSRAKAIVVGSDLISRAADALADVATRVVVGGDAPGFLRYESLIAAESSDPLPDECEGADIVYSSGTTGFPKGVVLSDPGGPIGTGDSGFALMRELFDLDRSTVCLSPAPLYHSAPLRFCLRVLRAGGTVVLMERFDAVDALATIERHLVTHSLWVPTMFSRLLALDADVRDAYVGGSHRFAIHGGAPCPPAVKQAMLDWWGPILHEYYAGTERNGFVYIGSEDWLRHPGSVGRPYGCTIHILDPDGQALAAGKTGTVYFDPGGDFRYLNDAAKSASARNPNGWSTLGDIGYLNEEGFLFLTDRVADVIVSGGVNIYPSEIEHVLSSHPDVRDAAVVGVPNEEFGEEVKAVVVASTDNTPAELERALNDHCRKHLAGYKCPRSIEFVSELPHTASGKLLRRVLRDRYRNR